MKSKELLTSLIENVDVFEKQNEHLDNFTMENFLSFMQSRGYKDAEDMPSRNISGDKKPKGFDFHHNTAIMLSRLVSLLYRYAKGYTQKSLEGSSLQTVEEFSYLVVLMTYDSLSKTELILKNIMGKTSGTEVIKRLLIKDLISQSKDKKDKRSQLVAITPKGLQEMKKVFPKMQMASEIITGNLSQQEQQTLVFLLQKLEVYHNDIFLRHNDYDLESLIQMREE